MPHRVLLLNGPNLNLLGAREPGIYGKETLENIVTQCRRKADALDIALDARQSNHEGELVGWIQAAAGTAQGIIINAGAFTHTSVAILDALQAVAVPVIEVHLSNIFRREHFRQRSYISQVAAGMVCGFGAHSYVLAVDAMAHVLSKPKRRAKKSVKPVKRRRA